MTYLYLIVVLLNGTVMSFNLTADQPMAWDTCRAHIAEAPTPEYDPRFVSHANYSCKEADG